jgi:hypothetical protein
MITTEYQYRKEKGKKGRMNDDDEVAGKLSGQLYFS